LGAHPPMGPVIAVAVLLVLGWLFLWLPSQRRQRAHRAMQDEIEEGDEIITAGGIHRAVREAPEAGAPLEDPPGTVVTLARRAVAAVARDIPLTKTETEVPPEAS